MRTHITTQEWHRAATLLLAIQREVGEGTRSFDMDSFLPPHLVTELNAVLSACSPLPERATVHARQLQMDEATL